MADAFKPPQRGIASAKMSNGFSVELQEPFDEDDMEGACAYPLPKADEKESAENVEEVLQLETSKILELFPTYG